MRSSIVRIVAAAICCATVSIKAYAGDLSIWPASDDEVGRVNWTGATFTPYFGYETLKLTGTGKQALDDPKGWRVGGELGYDFQLENLVLGVAADGYYTWYDGSGTGAYSGLTARLSDYATLRSRLGFATGRFMFYGTGGLAIGNLSAKDQLAGLSDSQMLTGWTAGAGFEWAYQKNLFLRFELDHIALGEKTFTSLPAQTASLGANLDLFKLTFVSRF